MFIIYETVNNPSHMDKAIEYGPYYMDELYID